MAKTKKGPITKSVEELCIRLCLMNGSETHFKKGLSEIVQQYGHFQAISMSLRKHTMELCEDDTRVWRLADEVDTRIRQAWEKYKEKTLRE